MAYVSDTGKRTAPKRVRRAKPKPAPMPGGNAAAHAPKPRVRKVVVRAGDAPATRTADLKKANAYKKTPAYKHDVKVAKVAAVSYKRAQASRVRASHRSETAADPHSVAKADRYLRDQYASSKFKKYLPTDKQGNPVGPHGERIGLLPPRNLKELQVRTTADQNVKKAELVAPALKILDQTTRPLHGIAGGVDAAVKGGSPSDVNRAAVRGLKNKDKVTFSKVLKDVGAPKVVQGIGGFALDVGLDPTTYATGGTKAVLLKSAEHGAERQAVKGVTVKFAGKEVPGVARVTAHTGRAVAKVGHKAAKKPVGRTVARVGAGAKDVVRDVNPSIAPAGADKAAFKSGRQVVRKSRAATNKASVQADRHARGMRKRLDAIHKTHGTTDAQVTHALDTNDLTGLPPAAQAQVKEIRDRFAELKAQRTAAGVREGEITDGYFPHAREDALHAKLGIVADDTAHVAGSGTKRTGPSLASSKGRKDQRPIAVQNPERLADGRAKFSTDVPLVYANYARDTGRVVAENTALRDLAASGRTYHSGDALKDGEAVYHLGYDSSNKLGLRPFKEGDKPHDHGEYVVLDEKSVDTVMKRMKPARAETATGRAFDRGTAGFKSIAVATPGFHIRNAIGDTQMAYLAQPGRKVLLPTIQRGRRVPIRPGFGSNIEKAMKVNRVAVEQTKQERKSLSNLVPDSGGTIKVAGSRMKVEDVLAEAERHGVVDSGKLGREMRDLLEGGGGQSRLRVKGGKAGEYINRKTVGRENVTRLSTFIHGLDKGMSPADAADLSLKTHIDYGDLTELERKFMRRAMPFYTFNARALPLHATKLVTHPGKFANYQKLREELQTAFGGDENDQTEFQQRAAGLSIGNSKIASFGLPLTLLNELPAGTDPLAYAKELGNYAAGLSNPIPKDLVELTNNYSFFFRDKIKQPSGPIVAAPEWARLLPDALKKKLGYTDSYIDKKSGEKVPGWDAYANYIIKAVPGPVNLANQLASKGKNQQGRGSPEKLASGILGIKVDQIDPQSASIVRLYSTRDKVQTQQAALRQQGIGAGNPHYDALSAHLKAIGKQIGELSKQRGDKIPLGTSRVKKVRKASGGGDDPWGGSSGAPASSKATDDPWG